jgi:hypothetical protein
MRQCVVASQVALEVTNGSRFIVEKCIGSKI